MCVLVLGVFFFSSRRRHTRLVSDWSSDVCSSDLFEELVSVDSEGAVLELFEPPGLERRADRAELLPELRPQHRQVRLHSQLARVDLSELDVLDAQLFRDLARVKSDGVGALDDESPQRLAQLDPGLRAGLAAELDHPAH